MGVSEVNIDPFLVIEHIVHVVRQVRKFPVVHLYHIVLVKRVLKNVDVFVITHHEVLLTTFRQFSKLADWTSWVTVKVNPAHSVTVIQDEPMLSVTVVSLAILEMIIATKLVHNIVIALLGLVVISGIRVSMMTEIGVTLGWVIPLSASTPSISPIIAIVSSTTSPPSLILITSVIASSASTASTSVVMFWRMVEGAAIGSEVFAVGSVPTHSGLI